uniref:Mogroside I-E synthase n=1 Tax=Siraitia grosvenorii TaxID=190515 RepID=74AC1_SIRGR|nr:RecName: Full=Mogroside IE synthase; AltName: Full=UDP-glycosyltransferase 74AC1 [Siraitia grosvenorii]AEM42999.1 UDP-glucosyltransferase [Siraitia grosvenorii]6L8Z_A Chain A, Glycosyltransferase [Siraitia grosvenorii]6L90_A Chain A, Glycosyltransferase [Siraitia grosvenorii]
MEKGDTHILVFPFPSQGHINPLLQLSKRLIAKGIKVSLVTTLHVSNHLQLQGAYSNSVKIEVISDGSEDRLETDTMRQTLDRFRQKMTKNLEDFLQKAMVSSNPPKFILYDSTMPWVLEVAKEFGLDRAPFYTQSCALNSINYHVLHGQLKLPPETPTISLPSMPLLRPSDLPAYDFDPASTDTIIDLLTSQYSNIQDANLLFCNTFDKLEGEIIQWMETLGRPVKTVGPTVPSAYLDKRVENDKHYGLSLFKPNEDVCLKWLDSKPSGSVLYVSYGSLVEMGEEQLKELALGIKETGKFFLWVVRDTEAEKLPPNFVESVAEKGLVVSWCSQLEVLAHPSVGCFFTHCGWNSTLEALCLGVPVVAFPQWADQVTNAKFLEDVWKVGKRVKRNEQRLASKEEVRSCIWEVMEGERASEFKSNSMEWKKWAKEAVDEGGSSDKNIEEFVAMLKQT